MKIKPILLSTAMVQTITEGRKTQTRRIIKPQPKWSDPFWQFGGTLWKGNNVDISGQAFQQSMKIKKGDILWVRETIYQNGELGLEYVADGECIDETIIPKDFNVRLDEFGHYKHCKIPSIYMPKFACRIFLEVTNVRVERLQDITEKDAIEEGIDLTNDFWGSDGARNYMYGTEKGFRNEWFFTDAPYGIEKTPSVNGIISSFFTLIASIHSWELLQSNPWVWVYDFKRVEKPAAFLSNSNNLNSKIQ